MNDTLEALQQIALGARKNLSMPVVGITGSAGKTTTRAMVSLVLGLGSVHQTAGNFNNHIGLPLTILQAPLDANVWVLEMGMNHRGEIDLLQNDTIERFCEQGALLKDGSVVPADLIVLATGYFPQGELVRRSLGEDMAGRIGQVWGQDQDGELSNMFKRTPQNGIWFIAGSLTQARIYSKYMALQIKGQEEGLIDIDPYSDVR